MTPAPFDDPRLDAAWRAYADEDRRLRPRPELEGHTLARVTSVLNGGPVRSRRAHGTPAVAVLALAATVAIAVLAWPRSQGVVAPTVLQSRELRIMGDTPVVEPDRPRRATPAPQPGATASVFGGYVPHGELPAALMLFDAAPLQDREPLQMVRLRLPREALRALGLVLLEPDAGGVVDVDVLVGEDGLPRDIRQVRIGREQR